MTNQQTAARSAIAHLLTIIAVYYNAEHDVLISMHDDGHLEKYVNDTGEVDGLQKLCSSIISSLALEFGGFKHLKINDDDTETVAFNAYV